VLAGITPDHPVLEDDWYRVLADAKDLREQKKPESPLIIAIDILLVDDSQKKNISKLHRILSLADYFFPNSDELWQVWEYLPNRSISKSGQGTKSSKKSKIEPQYSEELSNLKEISRDFFRAFNNLKIIGIKRGRHGVLLLEHYISPDDDQGRFKVNSVPSTNVSTKDIVDSTGAGDTWVGGFLSGALVSSSNSPDHLPAISQGARFGNAVAGCSIKHLGAVEWSRSCSEAEVLSQVSAIPTGVIRIEEEFC
jgi:sugar/nucleoside kinase (ribokinase family)